MTPKTHKEILDILNTETFAVGPKLLKYMEGVQVEEEKPKTRTSSQNSALWKYLTDLSNSLTEAGIGQKLFLERLKDWDVPITKEFLHLIWVMKQEKMFDTKSTRKLQTDQVTQVYESINAFTSTEFGVGDAFPSRDELAFKALVANSEN